MFGKKKSENKFNELNTAQVDQDLIVHNMPLNAARSGNVSANGIKGSASVNTGVENPHKFKIIGALIISLGVILVGILIYFSYRFIVNPKPVAVPATNNQTNQVVDNETEEDMSEVAEEDDNDSSSIDDFADPDIILVEENELDENLLEIIEGENSESELDFNIIEDADSDGLTDEEELVLGTDINNVDSDSDNYLDLEEIRNGYNPAGDGLIEDNERLTRYYNIVANYSILHPKAWMLNTTNNEYTAILTLPDNSLIQISVQPNNRMQDILTWYAETVGDNTSLSKESISGSNWEGIMGSDSRNFYLTDNEKINIYVISYIPVISDRVLFPNIFDLMIKSMRIE